MVEAAQVVVAHAAHVAAGAGEEVVAVLAERGDAEAVAVVAVQPDLAAGAAQEAEHLGDAALVHGRLVAVPAVGVAGDHEEGGVDAARILAGQHLGEGPVRIGAPRQMVGQPVRQVAHLARQRSQVEAAQRRAGCGSRWPRSRARSSARGCRRRGSGRRRSRGRRPPSPTVLRPPSWPLGAVRGRLARATSSRAAAAAAGRARRGAAPAQCAAAPTARSTAGSSMRRAGFSAKTEAENGRRPKRSRSAWVCSSQAARRTNDEATRSNGAQKAGPALGARCTRRRPGRLGYGRRPRAARPPAWRSARTRPAGMGVPAANRSSAVAAARHASARRRPAAARRRERSRRLRRPPSRSAVAARVPPAACRAPTRPAVARPPARRGRRRARAGDSELDPPGSAGA